MGAAKLYPSNPSEEDPVILSFSRNPYANENGYGVQRQFHLQNGPVSISGGNDRRVDARGYHHDNQVAVQALGDNWAGLLGARTSTRYETQPLPGLDWTRQWLA